MAQFSRQPVSTVSRSASSLATGSTPGSPRQTGQTLVLGDAPNSLAQPHHILERVLSWTCVSRPMTGSYSIRSAEIGTFFVPGGGLFVGVGEAKESAFAERFAEELQADGQL